MSIIWSLIVFVFWCIVGFALLHACVTHFLLWYENRLQVFQNNEVIKLSFSTFFKSLLIESVCIFLKTVLFPFKSLKLQPKIFMSGATNAIPTPILLVHGYLNHQCDWLWFLKRLQTYSNIGPIFTINLNPPFASISQLAICVKEKVNEIRQLTGASQIILVGHSMGGLVSSYFTEYLASPHEVAKVMTLASPFQGTKMAALGYGKNVIEMRPQSPFLAELNLRIQQSEVPYYAIASKIDNMILPWQSALLPSGLSKKEGENTLILEDHGHLRLLISPQVVEQISKWIAAPTISN